MAARYPVEKAQLPEQPRDDFFGGERPKRRRELREERRRGRGRGRGGSSRGALGGFVELLLTVAVAFALVFFVVRPYVVMSYFTPTESMVPTIAAETDRVLVNKFVYRFEDPERGDVVVLKDPDAVEVQRSLADRLLGRDEPQPLLKRVVGLPGEEIRVQNGLLFVDDAPVREDYLNIEALPDPSAYGPTTVPEGQVFVMGDNRGSSKDSRVYGPVPEENLEGEAFLRFWPLDRLAWL